MTINGATGSGKTHFGAWLLSEARFDLQPFVVVNLKEERLFHQIGRIVNLKQGELPARPGLYQIEFKPFQLDKLEHWLWKVWDAKNIGLFIDEGYMLPDRSDAFSTILTTGRSRRLPVYTLSQRPAWLSRFVFSEANFYTLFRLQDKEDRDRVRKFTPDDDPVWNDIDTRISKYHSRWYDVDQDFSTFVRPAPSRDAILARFEQRLTPRRRML